MQEAFDAFLTEILISLGTLAGVVVAYYLRKGILYIVKEKDIMNKKELAKIAVQFVEQKYHSLNGPEKFDMAKIRLADLAQEHGMPITEKQLETFIESAVRSFKDEFGEEWAPVKEDD